MSAIDELKNCRQFRDPVVIDASYIGIGARVDLELDSRLKELESLFFSHLFKHNKCYPTTDDLVKKYSVEILYWSIEYAQLELGLSKSKEKERKRLASEMKNILNRLITEVERRV